MADLFLPFPIGIFDVFVVENIRPNQFIFAGADLFLNVEFGLRFKANADTRLIVVGTVEHAVIQVEAHDSFLRGWEKLLHQPFLVRLEGFELLGLQGDQGIKAA